MKKGKKVFSMGLCFALLCALALPARAAEPWKALEGIAYYGDRSKCAMTEEQAKAFAERIETEMAQKNGWDRWEKYGYTMDDLSRSYYYYAALFDVGNGIPGLFLACAFPTSTGEVSNNGESIWSDFGIQSIWTYQNGTTVSFAPAKESWRCSLYDGYILTSSSDGVYSVYSFENGGISASPSTVRETVEEWNSDLGWDETVGYKIDGKTVTKAEGEAWGEKWQDEPLAYTDESTYQAEFEVKGLTPIDQFKPALLSYISAAQTSTRVTLHLNGGAGGSALWTNDSGTVQVPANPTREGYTFGGWFTDADLTAAWNFNSAVTGELSLYAKWVPVSSTASTVGQNTQAVSFKGALVEVQAYTLKADNGGDVTYVKLRDMAALLDGSAAQFNVDWRNGAIYVERGKAYTTRNSTELQPIAGTDGSYQWNTAPILFDGTTTVIEGIVLEGTAGSHTFLKLRDLADAIGFTVGWSAEEGITIQTKGEP